jgi:putative ABC transport system permease protein
VDHFRIALRLLGKRPGLTAGRLLTVTIVVTAASAVFAVANATFLRPVPFPHADRLVRLNLQPPGHPESRAANPLSPGEFERFRAGVTSLERIEGIWASDRAVSGDGEPEAVPGGRVSAGFFAMFGGAPALGRVFTEEEAAADARLVVLGYGFWQRRYGGDPGAVGRTLLLDREPHVIIGVLREGFEPAFVPSGLWTPLSTRNAMGRSSLTSVQTFGLLRPGHTIAGSGPEIDRVLAALTAEMPAALKGWTAGLRDLREAQFGPQGRAVLMLLVAVTALGLIAVANLANLTLADVLFRRADFALRAALGASRMRLASIELAQAALLAAGGAIAGLAGAAWLVPSMLRLDASGAFTAAQAPLDWRVALGAFGVAIAVMIAAVAAPVLRLAGPGLVSDLAAGSRRAIGGRGAHRARVTLVAAQTAVALILLAAGAQIVAGLLSASRIDPGFDPHDVITAQIRLSAQSFPRDADRAQFVEHMLARLRATPGVRGAGTTLNPFSPNGSVVTLIHVEDRPSPDGQPYTVQYRRVSPGYFEAMRIPVLRGRVFEDRDDVNGSAVAIVSRALARQYWGDRDPLGRRLRRGSAPNVWLTVVGVVDDVRDVGLNQPPMDTLYTPYYQSSNAAAPVALVVRTAGDPRGLVPAIKRAVWDVDPTQPLSNVVTVEQFLADSLGAERFRAILTALCGAIGLLLATIGTYGVTARSVVERTREVGIRLALGGRPLDVWWTIAWGSLRAVVAGAALGVVGSAAAAAGLAALLPEVRGGSWRFAAETGMGLVAIGALAAMVAARRATVIEPVRALRTE